MVALASCGKSASTTTSAPVFGVDTSKWETVPLPAEFKTPGTLRLPHGATLALYPDLKHPGVHDAAGDIKLADGAVVSILERAPNEMRDGEQLHKAFSGYGNEMLDQWRSPTGWVFIYKPGALKGELMVSSSNFTVEPGINCGKGLTQGPTSRDQANEIGAVCASLAHK